MIWPEIASDLSLVWEWVRALLDWVSWFAVRVGFVICAILLPVSVIVFVELALQLKHKSENPSA